MDVPQPRRQRYGAGFNCVFACEFTVKTNPLKQPRNMHKMLHTNNFLVLLKWYVSTITKLLTHTKPLQEYGIFPPTYWKIAIALLSYWIITVERKLEINLTFRHFIVRRFGKA